MSGRRSWRAIAVVVLAGVLNAALVLLPAFVVQQGRLESLFADPRYVWLLAGATLLFLADSASLSVSAADHKAQGAVDRRQHRLALGTGLLLWGTLAGGLATLSSNYSSIVLVAGGLLMLLGAGLRLLAILTLRRQFTSAAQVQGQSRQLVQRGIFRIVRHPSELGLVALAIGAAMLLGSLVAIAGAVALLVTSLLRIRWEDEQLALAWPKEFAEYQSRVPALVPFRMLAPARDLLAKQV